MIPAHVEPRHLAAAAVGASAIAVVGLFDPARHATGWPCPFRTFTGFDCPLCGATRATHHLLRGDVIAALDHNALYVAALPVVVTVGLVWLLRGRLPAWTRHAVLPWALLGVAVAFLLVRNLPVAPFAVLGADGVPQ